MAIMFSNRLSDCENASEGERIMYSSPREMVSAGSGQDKVLVIQRYPFRNRGFEGLCPYF